MINLIDKQKLMLHPCRICKWIDGETTYPVYTEISPTSACNHRCIWCAPSFFLNYKAEFLDTDTLKFTLKNMAKCGVKAVMYAGEGEPLLHKDIISIVEYTKQCGLDASLTTNGVLFTPSKSADLLKNLSWVKFSIDAGRPDTYAKLHGTKREELKTVLDNIASAAQMRNKRGYNCTIGTQILLMKENIEELPGITRALKYLMADYVVIKPLSVHPLGICKDLKPIKLEEAKEFIDEAKKLETDKFKVIVREEAFKNLGMVKPYDECYSQDFIAHIDSLGGVHSCINFIGDDKFCYGNIYESSFDSIWKNKKRIEPDLMKCRDVCRNDLINRYLFELKHPSNHVNFI